MVPLSHWYMLFSSVTFLFFFFPVTIALFYLFRNRPVARNVFLLGASLIYYFWGERAYTVLLVVVMAINYFFGVWIARVGKNRKTVLVFSILCNLLPLVFFKYTNFIVNNINVIIELFGRTPCIIPQIHLPIGISFFTFTMLSYVMDVYRDKTKVEKNPISLGIFLAMFPKMLQGPIERYTNLARDMVERRVSTDDFMYGVRRFVIGLGKKMIIA